MRGARATPRRPPRTRRLRRDRGFHGRTAKPRFVHSTYPLAVAHRGGIAEIADPMISLSDHDVLLLLLVGLASMRCSAKCRQCFARAAPGRARRPCDRFLRPQAQPAARSDRIAASAALSRSSCWSAWRRRSAGGSRGCAAAACSARSSRLLIGILVAQRSSTHVGGCAGARKGRLAGRREAVRHIVGRDPVRLDAARCRARRDRKPRGEFQRRRRRAGVLVLRSACRACSPTRWRTRSTA